MHEIGAEGGGLGARVAQPREIAVDIADDRRDLRERDNEAVGGSGHGRILRAARAAQTPSPVRGKVALRSNAG